jgi:23S rRNA (cytosine1962-C5)-methyltransferase
MAYPTQHSRAAAPGKSSSHQPISGANAALRVGAPKAYGPAVVVSRRASDRLREGHLWVYRSDVVELTPALGGEPLSGGSVVTVVDSRAIPLGSALFSDSSEITLRVVSPEAALTRDAYVVQVGERVREALALRQAITPEAFVPSEGSEGSNGLRLVFSEADRLPGIVIDRYNNLVIVQLLTQGTAQDDVRQTLIGTLKDELAEVSGLTIIERPDPRIRELEKLAAPSEEPLFQADPSQEATLSTIFTLNGLQFHFDATTGQKTGAFLDQRLNYAAAARYAKGEALDLCTYQGGFALHMAQTCSTVTGVDASRAALKVADRNLELNPTLLAKVDWIEADAFELMRDFEEAGRQYDTIVLDPPAFAKSRRAAEGALRGYKELNLRAMKMLRPGGSLITCSCSHHVPLADFMDVLRTAAVDAKRRVQILETRGAAPDHPAVVTLPETSYLKCVVLRVG